MLNFTTTMSLSKSILVRPGDSKVPLLLNLPATLAHDTVAALFIAESINLLCAIVPAIVAVFAIGAVWPEATFTDPPT